MTGEGLTAAERNTLRAVGFTFPGELRPGSIGHLNAIDRLAAIEAIITARTAQAEARGREAALREAADEGPSSTATDELWRLWLRARADREGGR